MSSSVLDSAALDPRPLLAAWRLTPLVSVHRLRRGTNNVSWLMETQAGRSVLRLYQNVREPAALLYEHRLLAALAGSHALSFGVPVPIPARSGQTLVPVPAGAAPAGVGGEDTFVSLFPRLPGEHPARGDVKAAYPMGNALGELDVVLATLDVPLESWRPATYGDLAHIHPLVPDPAAIVAELPLAPTEQTHLHTLLAHAAEAVPPLYGALSQQIIHSDFGASNVLMERGVVTGVLDFEFAAPDLGALDWAVGLLHTCLLPATQNPWPAIDAFNQGFGARLRLTKEEVETLPTLLRLRRVVSFIHRAGRWRHGAAMPAEVVDHVRETLALDDWLTTHGAELVRRAASAL